MSHGSSSDASSTEKDNESVQATMCPLTPRTSISSPQDHTFDVSDGPKRGRRNSNVRFREVTQSPKEEAQPSRDVSAPHLTPEETKASLHSYAELQEERLSLEDRINALENRFFNFELPRLSNPSERGDSSSERSGLSLEPQWMTWQAYLEPINRATNILEVLVEAPHTNTRRRTSNAQTVAKIPSGIQEVKNIERIRFRSPHIVTALQQITEQTFPSLSCFTVHRPFKILLFYRDAIEEYAADLENHFNQCTYCHLGEKCKLRSGLGSSSPGDLNRKISKGNPSWYTNDCSASPVNDQRENGPLPQASHEFCISAEQQHRRTDSYDKQAGSPVALRPSDGECKHEESEDLLTQQEAIAHLRALLKFMREDMREIFKRHDLLRSSHASKISFMDIWHLFMAGDLVVTNDDSNQMIYRVSILPARKFFSSKRPVKEVKLRSDGSHQQVETIYSQDSMSVLHIDVFYYNFDGRNFGPVETRVTIVSYDGLKNITDLPVYPLRFHPDPDAHKAKMLDRGRKYRELLTVPHWEYNGLSASEPQEQIDSQVIIDVPLAYRKHPQSTPKFGLQSWIEDDARIVTEACGIPGCTDCFRERFMFDDHRIDRQRTVEFMEANNSLLRTLGDISELNDDLLLLLPNRVYGFVLRSRRWYFLDIDIIHAVHRKREGFESLILPRGVARLVEGLVQTHGLRDDKANTGDESDSEHQFDLVRGKGKGLIILLHGASGVGKTSTAECVADYTHRPLFPITCGDIGESAKEVEQNLERNFSLAHRWGCVLLLDEADVFLQARDKEDMRRNSVVSVFLRVLEYYSGILFLTTNKVGHFDEAFKSRIHVSLYFPQLDEKTTIKIWKMNLKRLIDNKKHIEVDGKAIKKYARKHYLGLAKAKRGPWNGRQIKNAFQTAIALAEFDAKNEGQTKPVLTTDHFQVVAKAAEGFDEYLARIHGNDMDRARREGQRDDEQSQAVVFPVPRKSTHRPSTSSSESSTSEDSEDHKRRSKRDEYAKKKRKYSAKSKTKSKHQASSSSSNESPSSTSSSEESPSKEKSKSRKDKSAKKPLKSTEQSSLKVKTKIGDSDDEKTSSN
ncbi:hypothetical protein ACLMJK_000528 [Lecanora helva]